MAATAPYRVGAVVNHPKVEQIWPSFGERFAEQGFPLDVRYAGSYDERIGALLGGQLDTAWNTDLAHVQVLAREPDAGALAKRDTDRGWRSHLVALADTAAASQAELEGARVGFDEAHARPNELLFPMDAAEPKFCEPMELQYVNQWVGFDPDGYRQLIAAVAAGPVVVG